MNSPELVQKVVVGRLGPMHYEPANVAYVGGAPVHEDPVREHREASFDLLQLWPGARAVDVGCGVGDDAVEMAARVGAYGLVVGVDQNREMLAHARARVDHPNAPLDFREGSPHALGLPDASFDALRADRVLQRLPNPGAALAEFSRVVRTGGRVVVSEPDLDTVLLDTSEPELTARLLDYQRQRSVGIPGRRLRRLLADAGLHDVEVLAHTQVETELLIADRMLGLSEIMQAAVTAGTFSAIEALRWRVAAGRDSACKHFMAAITVFTAAGTRV